MGQPGIKLPWIAATIILLIVPRTVFSMGMGMNVVRMSVESYRSEEITFDRNVEQPVQFAFAKHFQNHMVLQKAPARANIYGFSPDIGAKVIVEMSAGSTSKPYYYTTTVKPGNPPSAGVWGVTLDPMEANVTVTIKVESEKGGLTLSDVIFGDVWICSGQSNMQFTVIQMLGAEEEIANAHNYPNVRIMTVAEYQSGTPLSDVNTIEQAWSSPDNGTIGAAAWSHFSAVCWLFGKNIHKELGYPIGLVATDWGGTPVEAWSSPQALAKCGVTMDDTARLHPNSYASYLDTLSPKERVKLEGPQTNSVLWNAMINPLLGMTIYGAIWYQGEQDASGAKMNNYNCTFPEMIRDWRQNFNTASKGQTNAEFPFGFVQLSANAPDPTVSVGFPDIRWHQTADYGYVPNQKMPNVFMAVAMDLPDFNSAYGSIHPQDKIDVGFRLTLSGLAVAYQRQEMYQGPFPNSGVFTDAGLVVTYSSGWTLDIRDAEGFEYLCKGPSSSRWLPTAIILSNSTSITLQPDICGPGNEVVGLRYAWRESPCAFKNCAVYETVNSLPAPPFVVMKTTMATGKSQFLFDKPTHI